MENSDNITNVGLDKEVALRKIAGIIEEINTNWNEMKTKELDELLNSWNDDASKEYVDKFQSIEKTIKKIISNLHNLENYWENYSIKLSISDNTEGGN